MHLLLRRSRHPLRRQHEAAHLVDQPADAPLWVAAHPSLARLINPLRVNGPINQAEWGRAEADEGDTRASSAIPARSRRDLGRHPCSSAISG